MKLKTQLGRLTRVFSPQLFYRYRAHRLRIHFRQWYGVLQREAHEVLFGQDPTKVLSGPFAEMPYLNETVWGSITPKWIGSYEAEIHSVINQIANQPYRRVVNIGCAEGYYAVGLAWRMPEVEVIAFDLDPFAQKQVARLAAIVGVADRLQIRANCSHRLLKQLISDQTLLLIDAEGLELELLDPAALPKLARTAILVEVHSSPPFSLVAVAEALSLRLAVTHSLSWFSSENREALISHYQHLWMGRIAPERFAEYLDEHRPEQQRWLWALPKL